MASSAHMPSISRDSIHERHTVIIGAGIIGCATAYYLSRDEALNSNNTIHLIESSPELFASASGKSGGFLAGDWFDHAASSLGELSFRLHQELADYHDGLKHWGYSRSTGTSFTEGPDSHRKKKCSSPNGQTRDWLSDGGSRAEQASAPPVHEFKSRDEDGGPAWLNRRSGDQVEVLGEEGSVAQVDPLRLSQFLLQQSLKAGLILHQPAKAVALTDSRLTIELLSGTERKTKVLPCNRLLIASGAWTPGVFSTLFPKARCKIPITPYAGHSLVVRSPRWTKDHEPHGCHAIFATARKGFSPEIFSRIGEEVYIAGLNSSGLALPDIATEATVDAKSIEKLKTVAARYLGEEENDLQVVREGLCFRPVTPNGVPILAKVPDRDLNIEGNGGSPSVFIAAGHGPWGIALSLGTGKVMAEVLEGVPARKLSADVRGLGMQ